MAEVALRLVLLESPYAGDVERNTRYARACMRDCLLRGEAPFASHLLYTQPGVLDDLVPAERELGIAAGLAWGSKALLTVVYTDLGISDGMQLGINRAHAIGRRVEMRRLPGWSDSRCDCGLTLARYSGAGASGLLCPSCDREHAAELERDDG